MIADRDPPPWAAIIWKHKWLLLAFTALVLTAAVLFTRRQPRIYEATTELVIDLAAPQYLPGHSAEVLSLGSGNSWNTREFFETQYRIIKSRAVAARVVDRLGLAHDLDYLGITRIEDEADRARALATTDPITLLGNRLDVDPVADSRVVLIRVQDHDPARAARIADAIAEAYAEGNVERKIEAAGDAVLWLRAQLDAHARELAAAEDALLAYKRDNQILGASLAERQNLAGFDLQDARRQLREAGRETAALAAELEQIEKLDPEAARSGVDDVLQNGLVQRLKEQRIALQNRRDELLKRYLETHPDVQVIDRQLDRVDAALTTEVRGIRQAIRRRLTAARKAEAELQAEVTRLEADARRLQAHELEYRRLETAVEQKKALYTQMQVRLEEARQQAQARANNVRILDRARVPTAPKSPRLTTNLAVALALALLGGLALILLVERLDNTVKTQDQLEAFGLTYLGLIPAIRARARAEDTDRYVLHNPNSTAAECVRTIRTNLLFMASERPLRSMMITSAGPREGKTATTVNIGATMAMSGSRTLLVDSDLRRPRLHRIFDADNRRGLTDLILDPDAPLEALTHETGVDGLHLLPSGPLPPNPSELLHTQGFRRALARLLEHYDRVIFDSPPVVAVTDAQILGQELDGTILVVRAGETRRPMLQKAVALLTAVQIPVLGGLLNDLDLGRRGGGEAYYQYHRTEPQPSSDG